MDRIISCKTVYKKIVNDHVSINLILNERESLGPSTFFRTVNGLEGLKRRPQRFLIEIIEW